MFVAPRTCTRTKAKAKIPSDCKFWPLYYSVVAFSLNQARVSCLTMRAISWADTRSVQGCAFIHALYPRPSKRERERLEGPRCELICRDRVAFNWLSKVIRVCFRIVLLSSVWSLGNQWKAKPNQSQPAHVYFPALGAGLAPVTSICFEFWLAHCHVYVCCDWPEYFFGFEFATLGD